MSELETTQRPDLERLWDILEAVETCRIRTIIREELPWYSWKTMVIGWDGCGIKSLHKLLITMPNLSVLEIASQIELQGLDEQRRVPLTQLGKLQKLQSTCSVNWAPALRTLHLGDARHLDILEKAGKPLDQSLNRRWKQLQLGSVENAAALRYVKEVRAPCLIATGPIDNLPPVVGVRTIKVAACHMRPRHMKLWLFRMTDLKTLELGRFGKLFEDPESPPHDGITLSYLSGWLEQTDFLPALRFLSIARPWRPAGTRRTNAELNLLDEAVLALEAICKQRLITLTWTARMHLEGLDEKR